MEDTMQDLTLDDLASAGERLYARARKYCLLWESNTVPGKGAWETVPSTAHALVEAALRYEEAARRHHETHAEGDTC